MSLPVSLQRKILAAMPRAGLSRRTFLSVGAAVGGGLLLRVAVAPAAGAQEAPSDDDATLSAYITIGTDGRVTILGKSPECGQGMITTLPMVVADELDVDWADVDVEFAPVNMSVYGPQVAGGSYGTPLNFMAMRQAGAAGRHMLIAAAAEMWGVSAEECSTSGGVVSHEASERSASYGELAAMAAAMTAPSPEEVALKDPSEFTIIGTPRRDVHAEAIVNGEPLYAIDFTLPDMVYAVFEKCPVFGGKVADANLDEIKDMRGVVDAFVVEGGDNLQGLVGGVAVVADNWWRANQARNALTITWDHGPTEGVGSEGFRQKAQELHQEPAATTVWSEGDVAAALEGAAQVVEATYDVPFLAHATLEPQSAVAHVQGDQVEIWSGSQLPGITGVPMVAATLGVPPQNVTMHQLRSGGGFGRRLAGDYAVEAAWIAKVVGRPVKLVWSREDDIRHDFYRTPSVHKIAAGLDAEGRLVALRDHVVEVDTSEGEHTEGALIRTEFPARALPNMLLERSSVAMHVPHGFLRAPGSNNSAFVFQSFFDELAHAGGVDPLDFQLAMMGEPRELPIPPGDSGRPLPHLPAYQFHTGRMRAVLEKAGEVSGWSERGALPARSGMGLAFHYSHYGHFAEVAQVRVADNGDVRVEKLWVVGDIGSPVINPNRAEQQAMGGAIDGLGHVFGQKITIEDGRVVESNFHDYPLMRMSQAPEVEVHFLETDNPATGLGEPSLPPAIPAVCNAIFAATGVRVRSLPLDTATLAI